MKKIVYSMFKTIDTFSRNLGWSAGLLILVIMLMTTYEVTARYAFNAPTLWVWPLNRQIFGVFILFAGIYAMSQEAHIRIEVLFDLFPKKMKQIAKIIALMAFVCFAGVLIWQGYRMGYNAWMVKEKASGAFRLPLYPLKMFIPVAAVIFMLEGIYILLIKTDKDKED
ncbi:TRAP transporter small permease [Desulfobacula sp.]|uniref:TRAP transporter small permease subunit n=1 Tax=Desulfobacula sp. TaxID=2593537 RepID=UPI002630EA78|nr:TRAP transporter small permease [Desulfobacula sp.]